MIHMKIGLDLDGTISENKKATSIGDCKEAKPLGIDIPSKKHEIYIITARGKDMREVTEDWLEKNNIDYEELYLYDGSFRTTPRNLINTIQSKFKSDLIKQLNLDIYVEDRASVREKLKKICPDCRIMSPQEFKEKGKLRETWKMNC